MTPSGSIPSGPPWSLSLELSDMLKRHVRLSPQQKSDEQKTIRWPAERNRKLKRPRLVSREIPPNDEGLPAAAFCA